MEKQYGLLSLSMKNSKFSPAKADLTKSVFGNDSDSDDSNEKKSLLVPSITQRRIARKIQEVALEEDPTVFQYDEVYHEIESEREAVIKAKLAEPKTSRYIGTLLKFAQKRALENERRVERMIQKERELEGEEFKDKETFITSAYKKKLEEFQKAEELEKYHDYLESIGEVTRQSNLDGFYRHLYEQKLGSAPTNTDDKPGTSLHSDDKHRNVMEEEKRDKKSKNKNTVKSRTYRKRHTSEQESDSGAEGVPKISKRTHLQSNLDADSDFSIDSSSESEPEGNTIKDKNQQSPNLNVAIKTEIVDDIVDQPNQTETIAFVPHEVKAEPEEEKSPKKEPNEEIQQKKKPKIDIWKKRTVGQVFDDALKRYYERKALHAC